MKKIISIFFIAIIISQSACKVSVLISYKVNHDFIVKYLCAKRDEPKNECDGKCWLKKELNKTDDNTTGQLPPSKIEISDVNYIYSVEECNMKDSPAVGSFIYGCYHNLMITSGIITDIFHPPDIKSL